MSLRVRNRPLCSLGSWHCVLVSRHHRQTRVACLGASCSTPSRSGSRFVHCSLDSGVDFLHLLIYIIEFGFALASLSLRLFLIWCGISNYNFLLLVFELLAEALCFTLTEFMHLLFLCLILIHYGERYSETQIQETKVLGSTEAFSKRSHSLGHCQDPELPTDFIFASLWTSIRCQSSTFTSSYCCRNDGVLQMSTMLEGWLYETLTALRWLRSLIDLPFEFNDSEPDWAQVWTSVAQCKPWKSMIKRACSKHVLQERIANEVNRHHGMIVQELRAHGCEVFLNDDCADETPMPRYACPECDRSFATCQALAAHEYQKHGIMSLEPPYVSSTTCMVCQQAQQVLEPHLRHCFSWRTSHYSLAEAFAACQTTPSHQKTTWTTAAQRDRIALRARIPNLRKKGSADFAWWHPESNPELTDLACNSFRAAFLDWCHQGIPGCSWPRWFSKSPFSSHFCPASAWCFGRPTLCVLDRATLFYDAWPCRWLGPWPCALFGSSLHGDAWRYPSLELVAPSQPLDAPTSRWWRIACSSRPTSRDASLLWSRHSICFSMFGSWRTTTYSMEDSCTGATTCSFFARSILRGAFVFRQTTSFRFSCDDGRTSDFAAFCARTHSFHWYCGRPTLKRPWPSSLDLSFGDRQDWTSSWTTSRPTVWNVDICPPFSTHRCTR